MALSTYGVWLMTYRILPCEAASLRPHVVVTVMGSYYQTPLRCVEPWMHRGQYVGSGRNAVPPGMSTSPPCLSLPLFWETSAFEVAAALLACGLE